MPLRFDLGPFEELHIGRCMITNYHERSLFVVEGNMPILRGKEHLREEAARTPLEKLYHCIQQMYLEEAHDKYQGRYLQLAAECLRNDPMLSAELQAVDQSIRAGDFFRALKSLKKLIPADAFSRQFLDRAKWLGQRITLQGSMAGSNADSCSPSCRETLFNSSVAGFQENGGIKSAESR